MQTLQVIFFVSDRSWLARSCFVISLLVSSDDVWVVVLADFQGQRGAVLLYTTTTTSVIDLIKAFAKYKSI